MFLWTDTVNYDILKMSVLHLNLNEEFQQCKKIGNVHIKVSLIFYVITIKYLARAF